VSDVRGSAVPGTFDGRRAIVTGGANGIGAAIVDRLVALGARVCVLDIEQASSAQSTVQVDLSDLSSVSMAANEALTRLGGVDVLVNCAGISDSFDLRDLDLARYQRVLNVNLHSPIILMSECGRVMTQQGYGRIVNVTSVHGLVSEPGCIAYDTSKGGLNSATRVASIDLADGGVLVNAVAPGFVDTRMAIADGVNELESAWFKNIYVENAEIPLRRAAQAHEIARTVAWLASEDNTYLTGQVVTVDGGMAARM
jgi:NAD(P)-dependent dehydrogenase (short-subunit alcohol dehydrogenase family)